MSPKVILCFSLLVACISAKLYAIDRELRIHEIPEEKAGSQLNDSNFLASAHWIDDRNNSGWTYYTYQTEQGVPDWLQTYTAGYLEGALGYELIWYTWLNQQVYIEGGIPANVTQFIHNQTAWMVRMILQNPRDNYWHLVNTTLAQVYGMWHGYLYAIATHKKPEYNISFDNFYTMTYMSDLFDVYSKLIPTAPKMKPLKCSFLLKLTNDNLFASHTTWFYYNGLLRTYKVLNFDLRNPLVRTKRISFSSQPGYTTSQDDFYILDNNRFVSETSLDSDNDAVYSWIHYESVPYWVRIHVANFVYDTQQNWVNTFFAYRSGTYNNQWLIVDFNKYNQYKNNLAAAKDIVWMAEEFYSLQSASDMTQSMLIPQGYLASYNVPYNASIQKLSQNPTNYTSDPRYFLFKKYAPGIQNIEDFKSVMRRNNHSDTGNYCQAIAARCDLERPNSYPSGALDCKVTSDTMVSTHQAWIINGPTAENLPPFNWDDWPQYANSSYGIGKLWNFSWVFIDPNNNFTSLRPVSIDFESESESSDIIFMDW